MQIASVCVSLLVGSLLLAMLEVCATKVNVCACEQYMREQNQRSRLT